MLPLALGQIPRVPGVMGEQCENTMDMSSILKSVMNDVLEGHEGEQGVGGGGGREVLLSAQAPGGAGGGVQVRREQMLAGGGGGANVLTLPLSTDGGFMTSLRVSHPSPPLPNIENTTNSGLNALQPSSLHTKPSSQGPGGSDLQPYSLKQDTVGYAYPPAPFRMLTPSEHQPVGVSPANSCLPMPSLSMPLAGSGLQLPQGTSGSLTARSGPATTPTGLPVASNSALPPPGYGSLPGSRKTSPPSSLNPIQPLPSFEDEDLDQCERHPEEKLAYFCPTCAVLACKSCAGTEHVHHNFLGLSEAFVHFRPSLQDLLSKAQMEVELLEYLLTETKKMNASVSEKQQETVVNVRKIFQAHREAVAKREQEVIAQINEIASVRNASLSKDEENMLQMMESVRSLSQAGEVTLQDGNKSQMLVMHYKLNSQLKNCQPYTKSRMPSEDDSFIIKSKPVAVQSALDGLCLFTTAPYPPLCIAMGEGLYYPQVNKLCTVIIVTKDRSDEPCLEGGEKLFVQLNAASGGVALLPIDVRDHGDGSYSISFRPQVKGEHRLVVAIRGQLIQGSPFTLIVDGGREYGRFGVLTQVFGSEGSGDGQFCRPWGICCDQHGNIVVGDRSNHRVQVFDSSGNFKYKFGSEGVRPGQFNRPAGVAVTREGHVVVADKDNHRIQVLKIDGTFLFLFGSKGGNDGQMIYPYDVAVNQTDGRIAVTDTGNHRLLIFSHDGILLGKFGYKGYLCGHFDSPRGIAFNDEGNIIVSDFNVHHILVIHTEGTTARILGSQGSGNGQFLRPQGIVVDHMSNFVIADTRNNRIVIMHPSGHFVGKFGTAGSAPGQFDRPTGVCTLPDGRVAVVDFGNSRIQIFNNCKANPSKTRHLTTTAS